MDRFIRIGNELIQVTEEVYTEYYKMSRRERFMANDIKIGRIDIENCKVTFIPSKEDSIERLIDQGMDFEEEQMTDEIICNKAMLFILQEAMEELNREQQEIIQSIYYNKLTVRDVAANQNVSHVAIIKRHKKILEKLKKYFYKFGYQNTFLVG